MKKEGSKEEDRPEEADEVSLLNSGEQRYIKAINNNNVKHFC